MPRAEHLVLLAGLLTAAAAVAAPEPRADLDVAADHADLDFKQGRARYWGNVTITHGSTRILADEVRLVLLDGELDSAIITGAPARFEQQPADGGAPTQGSARTMTFRAGEDVVELREDARIVQGDDEVAGELIRYDIRSERVLAAGGADGGGRVQMTITPRKPKAEPTSPPTAEPRR